MNKEDKVIMYDSAEAASRVTLTGWVNGKDGGYPARYYGDDEHAARWAGCTHMICECGKIREKNWLKCEECRSKGDRERYLSLPHKEWDFKEYVVTWDGDRYFFSIEDLDDYMHDEEIDEIDLLICDPINYSFIDSESVASDAHEDWEPPTELDKKIKEFNDFIRTLPPHSYEPGKIRTTYKRDKS